MRDIVNRLLSWLAFNSFDDHLLKACHVICVPCCPVHKGHRYFSGSPSMKKIKEIISSLWEAQCNKCDLCCSGPKQWLQPYIPDVFKETKEESRQVLCTWEKRITWCSNIAVVTILKKKPSWSSFLSNISTVFIIFLVFFPSIREAREK